MDTETHFPFDNTFSEFVKFPNQLNYYYFTNGFSTEECDRIIQAFAPKCVNDATIFGEKKSEIRKTSVTWIPRNMTTQWIYDKFLDMAKKANDAMFHLNITNLVDRIQFACYDESVQGRYDNHLDVGVNDIYSCRKLSISVQLSDPSEYEGGDLVITNNKWVQKDKGTVCVFPSFLQHRVDPVTKGKRYSLVLWLYGPPYS